LNSQTLREESLNPDYFYRRIRQGGEHIVDEREFLLKGADVGEGKVNRLSGFDNTFVNIILTLVLTLVISYLMFPSVIASAAPRGWSYIALACGLSTFIIKYLHESSVAAHRFGKTQFQCHLKQIWQIGLFFSRCSIPIVVCLFTAFFLIELRNLGGNRALQLCIGLIILHGLLYLYPDLYLWYACPTLNPASYWEPQSVIMRWLILDGIVILLGLLCLICYGVTYGFKLSGAGDVVVNDTVKDVARWLIASVMIGQSLLDWFIFNRHYFFADD
jgi:hypothetical protein